MRVATLIATGLLGTLLIAWGLIAIFEVFGDTPPQEAATEAPFAPMAAREAPLHRPAPPDASADANTPDTAEAPAAAATAAETKTVDVSQAVDAHAADTAPKPPLTSGEELAFLKENLFAHPDQTLEMARAAHRRNPNAPEAPHFNWYIIRSLVGLNHFDDAQEETRAMLERYPSHPLSRDARRHLLSHPMGSVQR
ncbi:MAG: hypothetical protein GX146_03250 [Myxococcales bacterium]|jgi:hypothetical protein|nr:hypothetical protein [Myxococcales bacterium]